MTSFPALQVYKCFDYFVLAINIIINSNITPSAKSYSVLFKTQSDKCNHLENCSYSSCIKIQTLRKLGDQIRLLCLIMTSADHFRQAIIISSDILEKYLLLHVFEAWKHLDTVIISVSQSLLFMQFILDFLLHETFFSSCNVSVYFYNLYWLCSLWVKGGIFNVILLRISIVVTAILNPNLCFKFYYKI